MKTQIRLRMREVWSESSLSAWRNFASLAIQNAPSRDSEHISEKKKKKKKKKKKTFSDDIAQLLKSPVIIQ